MQQEVQRVEMEHAHQAEVDELTSRHREQVVRLERDLAAAMRTRDEQLLLAESNKQQVCAMIGLFSGKYVLFRSRYTSTMDTTFDARKPRRLSYVKIRWLNKPTE